VNYLEEGEAEQFQEFDPEVNDPQRMGTLYRVRDYLGPKGLVAFLYIV